MLKSLLAAGLAAASVATLLGMLGRHGWGLELLSHFTVQFLVAQLACLAGLAWLRARWRRPIVLACAPFVAINMFAVGGYYVSTGAGAAGAAVQTLRVMTVNVLASSRRADLVGARIAEARPDVILFQEATPAWYEALRPGIADYPHRLRKLRDDPFSIVLVSRHPIRNGEVLELGPDLPPSLIGEICPEAGGAPRCLTVIGVHLVPPLPAAGAGRRNRHLAGLAGFVARRGNTRLAVLGDLNTTPWSPYFRELLEKTGLRDTAHGHGVQATWFSNAVLFGLPLDHVLVGPGVSVARRFVGGDVGSDHYPVIADIAF